MKRIASYIICFAVIFCAISPVALADSETKVYVTATGECYHRANCRYISDSSDEISLEKAAYKGYKPCSVCNPPDYNDMEPEDVRQSAPLWLKIITGIILAAALVLTIASVLDSSKAADSDNYKYVSKSVWKSAAVIITAIVFLIGLSSISKFFAGLFPRYNYFWGVAFGCLDKIFAFFMFALLYENSRAHSIKEQKQQEKIYSLESKLELKGEAKDVYDN